jgi:hypothetical protein
VPVLARTLEEAGLPTVMVTMMPYWAERVGTPRTLAVEFPFGHTLGPTHRPDLQKRVIREALQLLTSAKQSGEIVHSQVRWPGSTSEAIKTWQPKQPSPIVQHLAPQMKAMLRSLRERLS